VQVSWEEIARYDPDILVLMPCSFSLERTINEFATLHPLAHLPGILQGN
jgi:ABC-type Fe3+-hydroxamate transport system substrate-binding protein